MTTWIALFRGVNVGGNNPLPMAALRRELTDLGLDAVRTYIQSGNVVFESQARSAKGLVGKIAGCVEEHHGFRPRLLLLTRDDLRAAVEANPFPEAVDDPKTLHYGFLETPARQVDHERLEAARKASERYELSDRVFMLHAPEGLARSKLALSLDAALGVLVTSRNHRTVTKLIELADG